MAKDKNDYFQLMSQQVASSIKASELIYEVLCSYSGRDIAAEMKRVHEIEHAADGLYHETRMRLSREFITPIDQEDILKLMQIIDDVTDSLDQVMQSCYMYHVKSVTPHARTLADVVVRAVKALDAAVSELHDFKRPEKLHKLLLVINGIENEADSVYVDAVHGLFADASDVRSYMGAKAIYDSLEVCCDLCEHAADVMELIIMKNT